MQGFSARGRLYSFQLGVDQEWNSTGMKEPYLGWRTIRFNPIWPRPASTARILWLMSQIFPPATGQVHGPGLRRNDPPNAQLVEPAKDSPADPREFITHAVGIHHWRHNGPCFEDFPGSSPDDGDNGPGEGVDIENALSFFLQHLPIDIDEAHIIRTQFQGRLSSSPPPKTFPFLFSQSTHSFSPPKTCP